MAKQILILAYILTVLVISSMVRAADVGAYPVEHGLVGAVSVNPETGIMDVQGVLPTLCQIRPAIAVNQIDRIQNVITFDVNSVSQGDSCLTKMAGAFEINFDLKELPLDANKTYSIVFNRFRGHEPQLKYVALKVDGTFAPYRVNKETLNGTLLYFSSEGFAVKNGNNTIPVISPDMDLSRFQSHQVWISGYAVDTAQMNDDTAGDVLAPSSQAQTVVVPVSVSALTP